MKTCACTEPYRPEVVCPDCGHAWARHATPEGCTALVPGEAELGACPPLPISCRAPWVCQPLPASEPAANPEVVEVDFHQLLGDDDSQAWAIQRQLKEQLGRPYLATRIAAQLEPEVAVLLVQRIDEILGPELERRLAEHVEQLQRDVDEVTAITLQRLATQADEKRRELTRERFETPSRFA